MNRVAVVYWSGTGNTQQMAQKVLEGVQSAGGEGKLFTSAEFTADEMERYDAVAFGCPSMGSEQLEEEEFEPMFQSCQEKLPGKKIGLFGSYGWGDGEWMRNWEESCKADGAVMVCDPVICNEAPDKDGEVACNSLGTALAGA